MEFARFSVEELNEKVKSLNARLDEMVKTKEEKYKHYVIETEQTQAVLEALLDEFLAIDDYIGDIEMEKNAIYAELSRRNKMLLLQ